MSDSFNKYIEMCIDRLQDNYEIYLEPKEEFRHLVEDLQLKNINPYYRYIFSELYSETEIHK